MLLSKITLLSNNDGVPGVTSEIAVSIESLFYNYCGMDEKS